MTYCFGDKIRVTVFGQSHSEAIGAVVEGIPAGTRLNREGLAAFMARRAPGGELATKRKEPDKTEIVSGIVDDVTCGAPLCILIHNTDVKSSDYDKLKLLPRPSHADYTAYVKYGGFNDIRGGGQFSGRMTAPLCAAGYICGELLKQKGVTVLSHIKSVGGEEDASLDALHADRELFDRLLSSSFPVIKPEAEARMKSAIAAAASRGDSVGGCIECGVYGLKPGLGGPLFGGLEGLISQAMFAIPAVKGIEFGMGFKAAEMSGSEYNDAFIADENGVVSTRTNNSGGILGGISSGMPLIFRVAFKPTPSIALKQDTVDISTGKAAEILIHGRHDPCVVPRAAAVCEAMSAIALVNAD